jgi:hypothetical protein
MTDFFNAPTASFTFGQANASTQITFSATASNGVGSYHFSWDFGDKTTGDGQSVSHYYAKSGRYVVSLIVSDNLHESTRYSSTVVVNETSNSSTKILGLEIGMFSIIVGSVGALMVLGKTVVPSFRSRMKNYRMRTNY